MQIRFLPPVRIALTWGDALVGLGLAALLYLIVSFAAGAPVKITGPQISLDAAVLPYYSLLSFLRMMAAYILSLLFSLAYGYLAARNQQAGTVLLPTLDVLQSVPILSFLPVVLLALVAIFPGAVGIELAAIILIFTSMAWNLTYGFYYSLITIPKQLLEAAESLQLSPWLRFRSVELPFATNSLMFNSILSWAGGWFFLMAAEQFVLQDRDFRLPGIGSYLKTAAELGDISALLLGLAVLVVLIVGLDQMLWRPVLAWGDKFKLQASATESAPQSWLLNQLSRSLLVDRFYSLVLVPLSRALDNFMESVFPADRGRKQAAGRMSDILGKALWAILALAVIYGGARLITLITGLSPETWLNIAAATVATLLRVVVALVIALAWTLPLGVAIGSDARLANRVLPVVQVAASIPATALFPVLLLVLIGTFGGLNIAAILLMLLGTQWYLLFNIIAGAAAIPEDLKFTTDSLGIRGLERWRSFTLPAIFPYLITGMVTATGGAWNASIVAEYVVFAGTTRSVFGLGAVIAASSAAGDFAVLAAATLTMVATVVLINRVLWRRFSALAETRFRLD